MTTNIQRQGFFGDLLSSYDGDLNEKYDGLSYLGKRLAHIDDIINDEANGFYLGRTGRKIPFYAVKENDKVGIGLSPDHAVDALLAQQTKGKTVEERLEEFIQSHDKDKEYPAIELMNWYRYLTGSCYSGSKEFLTRSNLKDDDLGTVELFISMTENEYNGDIIKRLKPFYCKNEGV